MTNPDDRTPQAPSNAPSWVDEVLGSAPTGGEARPGGDLRIPEPTPRAPAPSWLDDAAASSNAAPPAPQAPGPMSVAPPTASPATAPLPTAPLPTASLADDWVTRATGGAKNPSIPQGPAPTATQLTAQPGGSLDDIERQARQAISQFTQGVQSGDVAQKKLIAGLLAIFLGSLGVHKFYLGMNRPGIVMLGVNIGVWVLAMLLGLVTLGLGLFITVPLASLVTAGIGLLGVIEGIVYLTKTDAAFEQEYVQGKKPWL